MIEIKDRSTRKVLKTIDAETLAGADLSDADLFSADLRGADLFSADLRGADLFSADLRGADLSNAKILDGWKLVKE